MTESNKEIPTPHFDSIKEQLTNGLGWMNEQHRDVFRAFLLTAGKNTEEFATELRAFRDAGLVPDDKDELANILVPGFRNCVEECALKCLLAWVQDTDSPESFERGEHFFRATTMLYAFMTTDIFINYCIQFLLKNARDTDIVKAHEYARRLAQIVRRKDELPRTEQRAFVERMMASPRPEDLMLTYREHLALRGRSRFG